MALFFRVVHSDLSECLKQISILRVPDLIPTDPYEVEVKVNVALRAKLVSEIKVNIQKLRVKEICQASINQLSTIFSFPLANIQRMH